MVVFFATSENCTFKIMDFFGIMEIHCLLRMKNVLEKLLFPVVKIQELRANCEYTAIKYSSTRRGQESVFVHMINDICLPNWACHTTFLMCHASKKQISNDVCDSYQ